MPRGPLGGPRPFADGELVYRANFTIDSAIGERLESGDVRSSAEKRIAQNVERVGFRDPIVQLAPAGFSLMVDVGLNKGAILPTGSTENGLGELKNAVEQGVKSEVDTNASPPLEEPEWEIIAR